MVDLSVNTDNILTPSAPQSEFRDPQNIPPTPMVGHEGLGGGSNTADDFANSVREALGTVKTDENAYKANNPIPFNRKDSGFDPLYNSFKDNGVYDKLGFIPGYDNDDIYARNIGKTGQFVQALKGIVPFMGEKGSLTGMAFKEGWRNEGDFWSGLFTGDLKKAFGLTMDQADLERISKVSDDIMNSNYIPMTKEQRDTSFNFGKFAQSFQQFGFTLGTTGQFLTQSGLEMIATALTAPETLGGSIVAEIENMTRRAVKASEALTKMYNVSNTFKKVMQFENEFNDVSKLRKVYQTLNDVRKESPIGSFTNFYRFSKEYNMAASEARFERAQSFTDYVAKGEQEFSDKMGRPMNASEKAKLESEAMDVSNANGMTNIALLYAMNRINMGNVLRTGLGLSKVIEKESEDIAGEIAMRSLKPKNRLEKYFAERAEKAAAKKAEKAGETAAIEGAVEKPAPVTADKPDPFMAKSDIKAFSNEWLKGKGNSIYRWFTDSSWEGAQEVAQNVSSKYWNNYYTERNKLSKDTRDDWNAMLGIGEQAITDATKSQLSKEGFDTFLSGFVIGVPSVAMNLGMGHIKNKIFSKAHAEQETKVKQTVDFLNNWAKSPLQFFDRKLEGYINQVEIAHGMKEAVKQGNMYAFKNLQRQAFQEFALAAHRAGKLDATLDYMENAAKDLSDEDFKTTFGIDSDAVNKKTAHEYVSSLKQQAKDFVEVYDDTVRRAPNPYKANKYKLGSKEYIENAIKQVAWDKTLEQYAFERHAHQDTIIRYKDILAANQKRLGGMAYTEFFNLTNEEHLDKEIYILKEALQIEKIAGVRLSPDQRKDLNQKRDRLEMLEKWKSAFNGQFDGYGVHPVRAALFAKHINMVQEQNNLPKLDAADVKASFTDLMDLYKFNKDQRQAITNLNYLADPENFSKLHNMHTILLSDQYQQMISERQQAIANRERVAELLNDEAFKQKHAALYQELLQARNNGESVHAGAVMDAMYNAEFPANTYEEAKAKEKEEISTEEPTDIEAKKADIERRRQEELNDNSRYIFTSSELFVDENGDYFKIQNLENGKKRVSISDENGKTLTVLDEYDQQVPNDAIIAGGLSKVKDLEFSNKVKDKINAKYDAELAALEITPTEPIKLKITSLKQALDAVEATEDPNILSNILDQVISLSNLSAEDVMKISDIILDKLEKAEANNSKLLSSNDPIFLTEYNKIVDQVTTLVSDPNITAQGILDAFKLYNNILSRLNPVDKLEYAKKLKADQKDLLDTLKNNSQTNDVKPILSQITDFVKKSMNFNELAETVFQALNNVLHPKHKDTVIEQFEKTYEKAIGKRLEDLKANLNTTAYSAVVAKLMSLGQAYKDSLEKSVNTFKQKSEELAVKKQGISFAVDYPSDFTNPVHRSIIGNDNNGVASAGQRVAIGNLLSSGILTQEDIEAEDSNSRHGASELINMGVARIFTLRLNKAAYNLVKKGDKAGWMDIWYKYQHEQFAGSNVWNAAEVKEDAAESADGNWDTAEELLNALQIPITDEITDEQFKLLGEYSKAIAITMADTALLTSIDDFQTTRDEAVDKGEFNKDDFFSGGILNSFTRFIPVDKRKNGDFESDFLKAFDEILNTDQPVDALKILTNLAAQYFDAKKASDGKKLLQALVSSALEAKHTIESDSSVPGEKLDEVKMIDILLSNDLVSLNQSELDQVTDFANNRLINAYKAKLASAKGNEGTSFNYNPEKKGIDQPSLGYSVLRQKDAADQRTKEDLNLLYNFQDGQTTVKHALTAIIYSEFATDAEKALAQMLLDKVDENDMISLSYTLDSAGEFDPNTGQVVINLDHIGFSKEHPSAPIETVILHELIHGKIEQALSENKEYAKEIRSLMAAAKKAEGSGTFYAFQESLSDDEQLREFVTEAMTNPAFQYLLSKVEYANSKRSVWDKFISFINKVLSSLGIQGDDSILSEVLSLTADIIENKPVVEERVMPSEAILNNIKNAQTEEALNEILDDLISRKDEFVEANFNALKASVKAKMSSIKAKALKEELKSYTMKKIGGETYYYKFENNRLTVKRKNRYKLQSVRKAEVIEKIVKTLLAEHPLATILPGSIIKSIQDVMGDPRDRGSYTSGEMSTEPRYETKYPRASEVTLYFGFAGPKEWLAMVNDYWTKYKKGTMTWDELGKEHGKTQVKNYGEIASKIDNRGNIQKLVAKGWIKPFGKGPFFEELRYNDPSLEEDLFNMYHDILDGIDLDQSDYSAARKEINDLLAHVFGVKVSDALQTSIEYDIASMSLDPSNDEEEVIDQPPLDEDAIGVTSTLGENGFDPSKVETDFTNVDPKKSKKAINKTGIRSTSSDLDGKGNETNAFKQFYHKIRDIINKLSVKKVDDIGDVYIVLDLDSKHLRWDGSKHTEGNVIGYLADANGNPIVYDKNANRAGTIDRNNLSDTKGLNNGENQIVYFNTLSETTSKDTLSTLNKEQFAKLLASRKAAMTSPQIGRLTHITQGQMPLGQVMAGEGKDLQTSKNAKFSVELDQPHIKFNFNSEGDLIATIIGEDGASNNTTLYPPKTKQVSVKGQPMAEFLIDLLQTYQEMKLAGDPRAKAMFTDITNFIRNMWYTSDKGLQIDLEKGIGNNGKFKKLFDTTNGLVRNEEAIQRGTNMINSTEINIWSKWLNGEVAFRFPVISTDESGKKSIKFVTADYFKFLKNNLGLKAYITTIPAQSDLKRYNSIVEFTEPTDLITSNVGAATSTDDLLNNPNAIKDNVKDAIDNAKPVTPKKQTKKRFKVPSYDQIFEKTCK